MAGSVVLEDPPPRGTGSQGTMSPLTPPSNPPPLRPAAVSFQTDPLENCLSFPGYSELSRAFWSLSLGILSRTCSYTFDRSEVSSPSTEQAKVTAAKRVGTPWVSVRVAVERCAGLACETQKLTLTSVRSLFSGNSSSRP